MSTTTIIRNAKIVNRGKITEADLLIKNGRIEKIGSVETAAAARELDAAGRHLLPGIIDDQVHFREPGLTHKADIGSESRAAVAGGVTSFMEMPNTNPPATTRQLLEEKYARAAATSPANFSFFMGTTNDNYDEVMRIDPRQVCGIKIFMGSSTGNMLVDSPSTLERVFANAPTIIATHCEDEATVRQNFEKFEKKYGAALSAKMHPRIRSAKACELSSRLAMSLAQRHGTRLHILHISTAEEAAMFSNDLPLEKKLITAEVCVHHLTFDSSDYARLGNQIKCNPAIKSARHRAALLPALLDNRLDIVATDHAPHTREEKSLPFAKAPSGLPLVQHSLNLMLNFYHAGQISLERIVEKMCHAPAVLFRIEERGFLDEGCHADLFLLDLEKRWTVRPDNILYRCGWSPLEGRRVWGEVSHTFVNGNLVWAEGQLVEGSFGQRLSFRR